MAFLKKVLNFFTSFNNFIDPDQLALLAAAIGILGSLGMSIQIGTLLRERDGYWWPSALYAKDFDTESWKCIDK